MISLSTFDSRICKTFSKKSKPFRFCENFHTNLKSTRKNSRKNVNFCENLAKFSCSANIVSKMSGLFYKYVTIFSFFLIFKEKTTLSTVSQIILHISYFCIFSQVIFPICFNPCRNKQLSKSAIIPVPVVTRERLKCCGAQR